MLVLLKSLQQKISRVACSSSRSSAWSLLPQPSLIRRAEGRGVHSARLSTRSQLQPSSLGSSPSAQHATANSGSSHAAAIAQLLPRDDQLDPGLYIVATPLGNLQDITLRALTVLKSVNLVLAEDTRHSAKLLNYYGIRVPELSSYHEHNELSKLNLVLQRLQAGEPIALVSDAGTPGISDPGAPLIAAAVQAGVRVIPVPGACAAIAAVVASGLPTDSFQFVGFLPPKKGTRVTQLLSLRHASGTLVFYAPPHGLCAILADMAQVFGAERRVAIARELTKVHEEFFRGTLTQAQQHFQVNEPRGEFVVLLEGAARAAAPAGDIVKQGSQSQQDGIQGMDGGVDGMSALPSPLAMVAELIKAGRTLNDAVKEVAAACGCSRKKLYQQAIQARQQNAL